jgi:hypothetical protein
MPKLKQISVLSLVVALTSAAVSTVASAADTPLEQSAAPLVMVVDVRPPIEKQTAQLSSWVWSCDNGVRRLGEEQETTPRLVVLGRDLSDALGSKFPNSTVTVSRYRVFFNASRIESGVASAAGGPADHVAAALLMPHDCTEVQTSGGWYSPSEVRTSNSPLIVEINATLNGKAFAVRTVYAPDVELEGHFGERIWSGGQYSAQAMSTYLKALREANAALINLMLRSPD